MQSANDTIQKELARIIQDVLKQYGDQSNIKSSQIPELKLYIDQVTTFLSQHLEKRSRFPDEKIITKTMVNNYTKNKLLPPPDKKKYSREHLMLLILIYYFKSYLSITDIQTVLSPLSEYCFDQDDRLSLAEIYDRLFSGEAELINAVSDSISHELEFSQSLFSDINDDNREYLDRFALICTLSLDIYLRKKIVEQLIDTAPKEI